jgi:hypothetical protein
MVGGVAQQRVLEQTASVGARAENDAGVAELVEAVPDGGRLTI